MLGQGHAGLAGPVRNGFRANLAAGNRKLRNSDRETRLRVTHYENYYARTARSAPTPGANKFRNCRPPANWLEPVGGGAERGGLVGRQVDAGGGPVALQLGHAGPAGDRPHRPWAGAPPRGTASRGAARSRFSGRNSGLPARTRPAGGWSRSYLPPSRPWAN